MKLKRFLLVRNQRVKVCVINTAPQRYYPPGVILEYEMRDKSRETKEIDLLHLTPEYILFFFWVFKLCAERM